MAKYSHGILGGFKGSIAEINGYVSKGIACIRRKNVKGPSHFSEAQLYCQNKFKLLNDFIRSLYDQVISPYHQKPQFSAVPFSTIHRYFFSIYHQFKLDTPLQLELTNGSLCNSDFKKLVQLGPSYRIQLEWFPIPNCESYSLYDVLHLCAINHDKIEFKFQMAPAGRYSGGFLFRFPSNWQLGDRISLYYWFRSAASPYTFSPANYINFQITGSLG